MKFNKAYIWVIAVGIVFSGIFHSCSDDFFDTPVGGRINPDIYYKSGMDAMMAYTGCFVYLQEIGEKQVLVDGLRSDLMDITDNADKDMINLNNQILEADNPYIDPSNYYKLIINVNNVLPNLPEILDLDRDFDSLSLWAYEGSLVTMRAWAYYNLAKLNGEVALLAENDSDPLATPEYLSKDEIIPELLRELQEYIDTRDIVRFPIDLYVLLGEMYLDQGDYANAVSNLKYAVDGPAYKDIFVLDRVYFQESWKEIFIDSEEQNTTVFAAVPYSFVNGQKNMLEEWMHINYSYMVKPTRMLINLYKDQELLNGKPGDWYRGVGVSVDSTNAGELYINKYSIDDRTPHSADVILYRAADVHLMLAEALNRLGDHDLAMILINDGFNALTSDELPDEYVKWRLNKGVRGRAYLSNREIPPSDTANPMIYIEDLIMEERAMELAFEGKRWFDLVRIAERRQDPAYLADKISGKFADAALKEEIRTRLMDPVNWYLPLEKVE